jgi:DNA-binding transcriptional LysR family regulator
MTVGSPSDRLERRSWAHTCCPRSSPSFRTPIRECASPCSCDRPSRRSSCSGRTAPSRDSLERLTWISREEGSATRISSDTGFARLGIVPRRRLELPSNEALVYAVKRGYGIAAISCYVVVEELRAGSLAVLHVRGWDVRNIVSVLRVRDAKLTPSADRSQTFVRAQLGQTTLQRVRRQS